ncbi:MAG: recombination protein RecR [Bacilli bacterium]|nr:recombination protein RecR [Bacilli bacterium]
MIYPEVLENLIQSFKKFPGIGEKNAERLALYTMDMSDDEINLLADSLKNVKSKVQHCEICGYLCENEICNICADKSRDHNLICVIEDYKSAVSFEKIGNYNGTYHILNGLISPIDGVTPEDINIPSLLARLKNLENPEIILALKSSIEGQTTTMYLQKKLENQNVKISRLSYGISMGADIDYLDPITLGNALEDRKFIN